jgi:hypothetical protein
MMVQMTPSQLILKLFWDNERPASSNVTLKKRKKVHWGDIQQVGWLADVLDVLDAI